MSLSQIFAIIDTLPSPWNNVVKLLLALAGFVFTLTRTIKFVPQGQRAMRKRFGKVVFRADGTPVYLEAGMHILFPFVHNLECVSILDRTVKLEEMTLPYEKFYVVQAKATVTFSALDIYLIRYAVDDFDGRLTAACESNLRQCLAGVRSSRVDDEDMNGAIRDAFKQAIASIARELGVGFKDLDITNFAPDAQFAIAGAIQHLGTNGHVLQSLGLPIPAKTTQQL